MREVGDSLVEQPTPTRVASRFRPLRKIFVTRPLPPLPMKEETALAESQSCVGCLSGRQWQPTRDVVDRGVVRSITRPRKACLYLGRRTGGIWARLTGTTTPKLAGVAGLDPANDPAALGSTFSVGITI